MIIIKILKFILLGIILIIVVSYFTIINNNQIEVKLVDCIDGDTARFIVNGKEEKVRFLGIDTPESTNYIEDYGVEASNYTCNMLKNANDIYIEFDNNSEKYDKYDRLLGYVFVDNNNLGELLLSNGLAEVKYIYGDYKYIDNHFMIDNSIIEINRSCSDISSLIFFSIELLAELIMLST